MDAIRKIAAAWIMLFLTLCGLTAQADDSICARVKIEIEQEMTLERQAFEAVMRISNGLSDVQLENVAIAVNFSDEEGNTVLASSDPDNTEALFFITLEEMENIADVDGAGIVEPATTADIRWLIVPAPGAAEGQPEGTLYYIGATLTYVVNDRENITEVSPDYIFVKPMPELTLDYFLPENVYGDDAFTPEVEPPVPFSLGVRVGNNGQGIAREVNIDSADLTIVENEQDLLIDFVIESTEVNGESRSETLQVELGDVDAGAAAVARWIMSCSLSGRFVEFDARFAHANELGGELTSLLADVRTHFLVRDVLVDLQGRDAIRDFLARDGDVYRVYESENVDTEVEDRSAGAALTLVSAIGSEQVYSLTFPAGQGFAYVCLDDPADGEKMIKSIMRSDGKNIPQANGWLSKTRTGGDPWEHFFNLFDVNTTGSYTVVLDDAGFLPQAPVWQVIPDRQGYENEPLSFMVQASDPNGTIPALRVERLPAGADFADQGDGTGFFSWTPATGQAGTYNLRFIASDGELTSSRQMNLSIYRLGDADGDEMDDEWEMRHFGTTDRDGTGDYDDDGYSDLEEFSACSNPTALLSFPLATTVELKKGLNIITIPADETCREDLRDWLEILGDSAEIDKVMAFDRVSGSYVALVPGEDNPAFLRQNGESILIYASQEKEVAFTSITCDAATLEVGLNAVGFNCPPENYTVHQLLEDIGFENVVSVQRFDSERGVFETTGFTESGEIVGADFPIVFGEGYFIQMKQAVEGIIF